MISGLEIVCQADAVRYDDPEYAEMAERNCNERRETRQQVIEELRSMIIKRGQCHPYRMDDAYLLKFLRCRRFVPALAHKLMMRYEDFRKQHFTLYYCNLSELTKVEGCIGVMLPENPHCGRVVILKFGHWDLDKFSIVELGRASLALSEIMYQTPRIQILGCTIIIDLEGLSLRHLSRFTPTSAHQLVSMLGVNCPSLIHGVHFVNYNWMLTSLLFICKQFIPRAALKFLHFHGSDMSSLHQHIEPQCLPKEYGGYAQQVITFEEWLPCVLKYIKRNDALVRELTDLGYKVKNIDDEKC